MIDPVSEEEIQREKKKDLVKTLTEIIENKEGARKEVTVRHAEKLLDHLRMLKIVP